MADCTAACSPLKPWNPMRLARRTTDAPEVPACAATRATVPKATASGSRSTMSATCRSAGESRSRCCSIRDATSDTAEMIRFAARR